MKKIFGLLRKEIGFTLVEMLVVLFIIGALLLIIIPNLTSSGVKAQEKACDANKKLIEGQAEAYYMAEGHLPTVNDLVDKKYLKEMPVCPLVNDQGESSAYMISMVDSVITINCQHQSSE